MLILIVGPYRSGTGNDPDLIQKNMDRIEAMALPIFEKGHIPMIGEWVANPIIRSAGSKKVGDATFVKYQYPVSHRVLTKCDALLRIAGASNGADMDVALAKKLGLKIYYSIDEIPQSDGAN